MRTKYSAIIFAPFCTTICLLFLFSCSKKQIDKPSQSPAPTIESISKSEGVFGTVVEITGTNFNAEIQKNKVYFNNKQANITSATSTKLVVIVPVGAGAGNVSVSVNGGVKVSGPLFNYKLSSQVITIAGTTTPSEASLFEPFSLAFNNNTGSLYISDYGFSRIRMIDTSGKLTTFAGSGVMGASDGTGLSAQFSGPNALAIDEAGNIFVGEQNNGLREITSAGLVSTIIAKYNFKLNDVSAITVDKNGNIFLARGQIILKMDPSGVATTFAGGGARPPFEGDNGIGTEAYFGLISGLAVDNNGVLYVSELEYNRIRKITPDAVVTTFSSGVTFGSHGEPIYEFDHPAQIAIDKAGNIFVADGGHNLIKKIAGDGSVATIAGTGQLGTQDGPLLQASFSSPHGIAVDNAGNIYVSDGTSNLIRKIIINQ
jgi:hypothetical protein